MADRIKVQQYRYQIEFQYLNIKKGTYRRIYSREIDWVMIDRDYDKFNMPILYASINVDINLADDMIRNYRENLMNVTISKHAFDSDDSTWMESIIDEEYINGQFEYFTDAKVNDNTKIDNMDPDDEGEKRDRYRKITIGLMKLSLINSNKKRFNTTLFNTTMTDAIMNVTKSLQTLVLEPLPYNDILTQIIIPSVDSISKVIASLNSIKVLYSTPYRFFMDFNYTYLISTGGISIPRKGQRITDLLYCVKDATDITGMQEGMYINKKQKNYQINVSSVDVDIYDNQSTEKNVTNIIAINTSGDKQEESLNINKSTTIDTKYNTVSIPNDNLNMIENIKSQAEIDRVQVCIIKDNIDSSVVDINGVTVIHHIDEDSKYNGQYILSRKRELLLNDGYDFTMTVIANYKKLTKVL